MNESVPSPISGTPPEATATDEDASPPFPLPPEYSQIYEQLRSNAHHDPLRDFRNFLFNTRLGAELRQMEHVQTSRSSVSQCSGATLRVRSSCNSQDASDLYLTPEDLRDLRTRYPPLRLLSMPVMRRYAEAAKRIVLARFQSCLASAGTSTLTFRLSLFSLGAQALCEENAAIALHSVSLAMLVDELYGLSSRTPTSRTQNDAQSPSSQLCALLLINEFVMLQQADDITHAINAIRAHALSCMSRSALVSHRTARKNDYGNSETVCQIETHILCMLYTQTLLIGTEIDIAADSRRISLLRCVGACAQSQSADGLYCRCPEIPTLRQAVQMLQDSTTSSETPPWLRSATNIYIIIIYILYHDYSLQQLWPRAACDAHTASQHTSTWFAAAMDRCDVALRELEFAQQDVVEPSLLGIVGGLMNLARIRQVFDADTVAVLRSADVNQSAELILSRPLPQRNPQVASALKHCANIFEVPSKMGIMLYARTKLGTWSLEQTMAAYEYTILLSKWLDRLSSSLREHSATIWEEEIYIQVDEQTRLVYLDLEDSSGEVLTQTSTALLSVAVVQVLAQMFACQTNRPLTQRLSRILNQYVSLKQNQML